MMEKTNKSFCVFILSHGRPDKVYTYQTLEKAGFNGDCYVLVDNEDESYPEYVKRYGEKVIQFDKAEIAKRTDTPDLSDERRTVIYARNACFDIAKRMGYNYFLELDDDYTSFNARYLKDGVLKDDKIPDVNPLFDAMIDFLIDSNALTVAMGQSGDYIGGVDSGFWQKGLARKAMNTFFCSTDRPFSFVGRINEDVNTYTSFGNRGKLIFTATKVAIHQKQTQANSGGMTDAYLDSGTYLKSFYSVIYCPSAVKVGVMGASHKRMHHSINWDACAPKILSERYRKQ